MGVINVWRSELEAEDRLKDEEGHGYIVWICQNCRSISMTGRNGDGILRTETPTLWENGV